MAIFSDSSTSSIDFDIELDEMELVAAAAGYLYYQSLVNQPPGTSPSTRGTYLKDLLQGPVEDCREVLRMDKRLFHKLSDTFREKGLLRDTITVLVEEQVAIFLSIIGHNQRIRVIQERFHLSCETISRHFNNVLKAVKAVSRGFFQPPVLETHEDIVSSKRLYPYFKVKKEHIIIEHDATMFFSLICLWPFPSGLYWSYRWLEASC